MKNAHNLGTLILFPLDGDHVSGIIVGIHESINVVESTPAWEKKETTYRYRVEVEQNDVGFVWIKHEDIIDNIN